MKCEILGVSYLMVDSLLSIQMFGIPKYLVFSFMDVLLIFLKYLRSVLFPRIVISAFTGFVFHLCQDLNCLMTGSRF